MSELSYEASDEASENELLDRSLSVWRGWSSLCEDFTPIPLDIHTASSIGQYDCVRTLIARGEVEIDRKNIGGWTPLMYACYIGHDHIVGLLIDAGCNVNLKNQRGQSPLMLAASCGNETVGRTLLRKGAELEAADRNGWTALFHATYSGHQNFVSFLLDQRANMDAVEPSTGMTPFMEAAIEGHEIIVQLFLQHGVNVSAKAYNGDTARTLALMYGYMKIVSLIDNHCLPHTSLRSEPGLGDYLSSSDEVDRRQRPQHQRSSRAKSKGPSIRDGPEAIARMIDRTRTTDHHRYPHLRVPRGYMSFPPHGEGEEGDTLLSYRDVTSPINQEDYHLDSSGGKDSCDYNDDSNAFSKTGAITIKSSSSSSGGLIAALGLSRQNSADSDDFLLHDSGVHNSSQSEDNENVEARPVLPVAEEESVKRDDDPDDDGANLNSPGPDLDTVGADGHLLCENVLGENSLPRESGVDISTDLLVAQSFEKNQTEEMPIFVSSKDSHEEDSGKEFLMNSNQVADIFSVGPFKEQSKNSSGGGLDPFHMQFGELFPENSPTAAVGLGGNSGKGDRDGSTVTVVPGPHPEHYAERILLDPGAMFEPQTLPRQEDGAAASVDLMMGAVTGRGGGSQYAAPAAPSHQPPHPSHPPPHPHPHMQRRSSCQARLSRLSLADRGDCGGGSVGGGGGKESRHRRKSANSPPSSFQQRDYSGRGGHGHDLGSGTGRVTCLSDIPTNPGPQAGYPVVMATPRNAPSTHQLPATMCKGKVKDETGVGVGDRFHGNSQVPVAAVAPTCLPTGGYPPTSPALTPHPASAFMSAPGSVSGNHMPRKRSAPELSTSDSPLVANLAAGLVTPGYQSDGREPSSEFSSQQQQNRLSELVGELPGGEGSDVGVPGHRELAALLDQLGLGKYAALFVEQDVDLQVFLSLTDNDLKEIGIKLFGPRKKMTNAIARWHSQAPAARSSLEQAYADRLEGEMQEMAIQLNQAYDSVEKLRAQVLQERQLRSVTESCLMEERGGWQRVHHSLMDTRQQCTDIADAINKLSSLLAQLKQQLGHTQNNHHPVNSPTPTEMVAVTTDQLTHLCDQYLYDLCQQSATLTRNLDLILSSAPVTRTIQEPREVDQGFP